LIRLPLRELTTAAEREVILEALTADLSRQPVSRVMPGSSAQRIQETQLCCQLSLPLVEGDECSQLLLPREEQRVRQMPQIRAAHVPGGQHLDHLGIEPPVCDDPGDAVEGRSQQLGIELLAPEQTAQLRLQEGAL
jgi:hypothetical protein